MCKEYIVTGIHDFRDRFRNWKIQKILKFKVAESLLLLPEFLNVLFVDILSTILQECYLHLTKSIILFNFYSHSVFVNFILHFQNILERIASEEGGTSERFREVNFTNNLAKQIKK